jgi:acetolactate synthase I/II/III large subunit
MSSSSEPLYWDQQKPWGFELVANTLVERGVECVFALTGNSIISLLAALGHKGIKVVTMRSEQGAVLAATGYAVSSGKVGVAIVTAGYMSIAHYGLLNASWGHVPVVVIAGANETFSDDMRSLQELDQKPIAKSAHVKEAYHITKNARIPQMLTWAFKAAQSGIPGCAFVDIAQDVLKGRGDASELSTYATCVVDARPAGDPKLIKKAVQALAAAQKPIIEIGRLAVASGAGEEVKELVQLTGIPVANCMGTLGAHPLNIGMAVGNDAETVLMLGKQNMGMQPQMTANQYVGKIISVYPDAANIGHSYPVEMGIVGDVKLVLQQMIEEARKVKFPDYSAWVDELRSRRDGAKTMFLAAAQADSHPIHPARLAKETVEFMLDTKIHKDAIMSADGGDCMTWYFLTALSHGITQEYPGQLVSILSVENGTAMGLSIPMAVGAVCARPGKFLFIPAMGDGALGYHLAELETLARLKVPAVIIVCNNNCWGQVYNDQRRIYGRGERTGGFFSDSVHYEKAAEGLGCIAGEFVTETKNIRPALDKAYETALRESKPVVINVITDPFIYNIPFPNWTLPATEKGEPYKGIGEA